ncbi:hypothetical protein LA080_014014 [Diaporthe eres]|nr:hypothetical protein LA080_014014 [Diaporthe eres]
MYGGSLATDWAGSPQEPGDDLGALLKIAFEGSLTSTRVPMHLLWKWSEIVEIKLVPRACPEWSKMSTPVRILIDFIGFLKIKSREAMAM